MGSCPWARMPLILYSLRRNEQLCWRKFKLLQLTIQNSLFVNPHSTSSQPKELIKLQAFLLSNITLTGLPLLLFITFTITVFVFSLVAALLIALLVALLFTVFMVGVALLVVLPTVFMTTMAASFIFVWGMGGYYILKWFGEPGGAVDGEAIGDKLNNLTGGRLGFLMEGARDSAEPNDHLHGGPKYEGKGEKGSTDEKAGLIDKDESPAKAITNKAGGATSAAKGTTKHVDGIKSKAGGATGTAKGAISGATGLG
jgi:hypothetical protein